MKESMIDATHDPRRQSWVESANGHPDFPIQNLPFVIFSARDGTPRGGVAIGDSIFDLRAALDAGLFSGAAESAARAASGAARVSRRCFGPPRDRLAPRRCARAAPRRPPALTTR